MKKRALKFLWLVAWVMVAVPLFGADVKVPVGDAEAVAAWHRTLAAVDEVFGADLTAFDEGELLSGVTAETLSPGRYRYHVAIALAPLADAVVDDMGVMLMAGGRKFHFQRYDFLQSDRYQHLAVEFTVNKARRIGVSVAFENGKQGRLARGKNMAVKAKQAQAETTGMDDEAAEDEDDLLGDIDLEENADGSVAVSKARGYLKRIYCTTPIVERLPSVGVEAFAVDKLLYAPGDKGMIKAVLRNHGTEAAKVAVTIDTVSGLSESTAMLSREITVAAGGSQEIEHAFEAAGRFGFEARFALEQDGQRQTWRDYFSVTDDFHEVAIGSVWGSAAHTGLGRQAAAVADARKIYSNLIEIFFWAPCDWSTLVADREVWWSGQTGYPENESNMHDFVRRAHQEGIKMSAYCSAHAMGPYGWEWARRRPDWFHRRANGAIAGSYSMEILDHWNDPEWRAQREEGTQWQTIATNLTRLDTLDHGIDQIIASAKHYKWDGVRFDGHYRINGDDAMSTRNMRRLKERVWEALPHFKLGYNWGRAPEWRPGYEHELAEAMAGGGYYMNEGIRSFGYTNEKYGDWPFYATNELRIAKMIQELGGTYHCIWDLEALHDPQRFYKLVYGLVAGAHPCYGSYKEVPGCAGRGAWGTFMTRWSAILWDRRLRSIAADGVTVNNPSLYWQPLIQERVLSPSRKQVIVHLVNPSPTEQIDATRIPSGHRDVSVGMATGGQKVEQVQWIRPDAVPYNQVLEVKRDGERASVVVPEVRHWGIVVWELASPNNDYSVPADAPRFTEPPKLNGQVKAGGDEEKDPNKLKTGHVEPDGSRVKYLSHGSQNVGPSLVADPTSPTGTVEWRPPHLKQARVGMSWMGEYGPGRYEVSVRVKWADPAAAPAPQSLYLELKDADRPEKEEVLLTKHFVTPGYTDAPAGARELPQRGAYHWLVLGEVEKQRRGYMHLFGSASTKTVGKHTMYLNMVKFRPLERYGDAKAVRFANLPAKPDGLRKPMGSQPKSVLFVKGMFWQQYASNYKEPMTQVYKLPDTHEALYAYDCVVLANINLGRALNHRRLLSDFVRDGGRLVVLGGSFTLGQGGMPESFLEPLLPVVMHGDHEVVACDPPLALGAVAGKPAAGKPTLFWRHLLKPRDGAKVLAYAGNEPVAMSAPAGEGIAVVFGGTTMGEAKDTQPFWETPYWPRLFKAMITEN